MTIQEKGALVRALYTNTPEAKDELFFRKGDILTVIEYDHGGQAGWWLCALRGQRGICPSNYLEILEDKYSTLPPKGHTVVDGGGMRDAPFDPLETYDVPRSVDPIPVVPHHSLNSTSRRTTSLQSFANSTSDTGSHRISELSRSQPLYCNEPVYENDAEEFLQPGPSPSPPQVEQPLSNGNSASTSGLDLYDVPRSEFLCGQSIARLRKYGSCATAEGFHLQKQQTPTATSFGLTTGAPPRSVSSLGLSRRPSSTSPPIAEEKSLSPPQSPTPPPINYKTRPSRQNSTADPSSPTTTTTFITPAPVQLRRKPGGHSRHLSSNRSSALSEAESGIVMLSTGREVVALQDLYDVPRGSSNSNGSNSSSKSVSSLVQAFNKVNNPSSHQHPSSSISLQNGSIASRPASALSVSSSGLGMSLAESDSKDSLLDCVYDVPRNNTSTTSTVIKAYVNHMETKYDEPHRNRHDSCGYAPTSSSTHHLNHHNSSTSSLSSANTRNSGGGAAFPPRRMLSGGEASSTLSRGQSIDELYDVPRGTITTPTPSTSSRIAPTPPPLLGRKPLLKSVQASNSSLNQEDTSQFYDVPSEFARKVSLDTSRRESSNDNLFRRQGGSMSTSLSSISSQPPHHSPPHARIPSTNSIASALSFDHHHHHRKLDVAVDVKLLPLGPKAAVSVCEKLRQEVVSSIATLLNHVRNPTWRSKENLTEVMPDLKFTSTRLCLAIKDLTDFASRSLANAKRLSDESVPFRLHRLLTPVINGSQIIQRDVDELDAYFWSVDRLSVAPGTESSQLSSTGDALDQLILCSRSLKHDVTELANFLALHSTALYKDKEDVDVRSCSTSANQRSSIPPQQKASSSSIPSHPETQVEDTHEDYDYVSLVPTTPRLPHDDLDSENDDANSQKFSTASTTGSTSTSTTMSNNSWQLDSRDQQLLEFYSAQVSVTAPQLSQAIATFISAIQQNEPPAVFNIHLKYVILLGYKLLFAGDTVHRNLTHLALRADVEARANDLHKSILALYEQSKVATTEFPKIAPMQAIVDRVWATTTAATHLKKVIFNAVHTASASCN